MAFKADKPYNDLPLLPPQADLESKAILKKCVEAARALAELKGAAKLIPDPSVLINSIPLREAQASSEIENIVTTADALFRAAALEGEPTDQAVKEVLSYRSALRQGFERLQKRPISTNMFIEICSTLKNTQMDLRKLPGTKIINQATGKVVYTPPEGEAIIRSKLDNLEKFLHAENGLDPLIRLAVIHYQFEAIHPFHDGNGRTGRILNLLFLVERQLLDMPVLYLSRYIIEHKDEYYKLLRLVTESDQWEKWILYMLEAVASTAKWTTERIKAIHALMMTTTEKCKNKLPGSVYSLDLMQLLFRQPYCKIGFLVGAGLAGRQTAARYLEELEKLGILEHQKVGREKIYLNRPFLRVLVEK